MLKSFPNQNHVDIDDMEIHYFTAWVKSTDSDKDKSGRQHRYNSALTRKNVMPHYGKFNQYGDSPKEKQSDVNLATYFVHGAYPYPDPTQGYDYAVIISNDTDFCGAIRFVLETFKEKVVDVWTVNQVAKDLSNLVDKISNMRYHEIPDSELQKLPQIANDESPSD